MTKREFVEELAKRTSMSKRQVEGFLQHFTQVVSEKVSKGQKVSVTGFGVFDLGKRAARRGVDPRTQAEIKIPAMKMPRFRAGKRLKEAVRKRKRR
ncbi:HU family DNA-binding protein [Candidatus Microgenomates bacterium]|nr:HU family DNA-binding protein [Candidatus Microgenomates bacterium]